MNEWVLLVNISPVFKSANLFAYMHAKVFSSKNNACSSFQCLHFRHIEMNSWLIEPRLFPFGFARIASWSWSVGLGERAPDRNRGRRSGSGIGRRGGKGGYYDDSTTYNDFHSLLNLLIRLQKFRGTAWKECSVLLL
ncbi:hypothetical protein VTL71DRAFT_10574 [Oculimacula yallundae]|uniref:Uncharacterized protein n=1 Tax=Oculimacula yallundae TaxID=86028 RepID=A0ABR4CTH2_9HELO